MLTVTVRPSLYIRNEPSHPQYCSAELHWTTWRKRNQRTRGQMEDKLYWVWKEKAIEHLPWKSRCASGRILFAAVIFLNISNEKSLHLQPQKSSILPDLKVDTRIADTAYSSQRLYPEVEKTMKYYENRVTEVEYRSLTSQTLAQMHAPALQMHLCFTWICEVGGVGNI